MALKCNSCYLVDQSVATLTISFFIVIFLIICRIVCIARLCVANSFCLVTLHRVRAFLLASRLHLSYTLSNGCCDIIDKLTHRFFKINLVNRVSFKAKSHILSDTLRIIATLCHLMQSKLHLTSILCRMSIGIFARYTETSH